MKIAILLLFAGVLYGQTVTDVRGQWNFLLPPTGVGGVGSTGYCASTSTSGLGVTWSCTPSPAITTLAGAVVTWVPDATCGANPTLNVNGLGAKTIKDAGGSVNLWTGGCTSGNPHTVAYDGTNWRALDVPANILTDASSRGTCLLYTDGQDSCAKCTQTSAQIKSGRTGVTSAEDDVVTIPANAHVKNYSEFIETTAFAGLSAGFGVSLQAHGNTSGPFMLATCTLEGSSGHACQMYPGNVSPTASWTLSAYYTSTDGTTTFNSLSAGTGVTKLCVSQGQ